MTDSLKVTSRSDSIQRGWHDFRTSKTQQRLVRNIISYTVIAMGTIFMLFPMLWMISASLKPSWQIFSDPIIWIPQRWEDVRAGQTNRFFPLWETAIDGTTEKVIRISNRRYTSVIDASKLSNLQSIPTDEISDPTATTMGDVVLNIRTANINNESSDVIALSRDGDNLIVVAVSELTDAVLRYPLDIVNGGDRANLDIEDVRFRGRSLETDDGTLEIIPIGPESELIIVGEPEIAEQAMIVSVDLLNNAGISEIGDTSLNLWTLGNNETEQYILLSQELWQPIIDEETLDSFAFSASNSQLDERELVPVQDVEMQVAQYTPDEGEPYNVVILVSGTNESLVIPVEQATTLRLAVQGGLINARGDTYGRISYRVQEGFEEVGKNISGSTCRRSTRYGTSCSPDDCGRSI